MRTASSPPEIAARHETREVDGAAGARIFRQSWVPQDEPRAHLVLAHGASEHSGRYRHVVERLVPDGVAVHALDHRGHGRSSGGRGQIDRMDHVLADLDALVDDVRGGAGSRPVFLLGHSMGGCIAIAYAVRRQAKLDGLALSAPLAALAAAPAPLRLVARVLSAVTPGLGVYGVDASAVSRDPEEVRAYREDPLVHHGKLPARTVHELAAAVGRFEADAPRLTLPLLVLLPLADTLAPPEGGRMVHDRAASADKTLHEYPGFFHEQFNEPAGERERPLDDLARWIAGRSD